VKSEEREKKGVEMRKWSIEGMTWWREKDAETLEDA